MLTQRTADQSRSIRQFKRYIHKTIVPILKEEYNISFKAIMFETSRISDVHMHMYLRSGEWTTVSFDSYDSLYKTTDYILHKIAASFVEEFAKKVA